jgi:hypothetical protein
VNLVPEYDQVAGSWSVVDEDQAPEVGPLAVGFEYWEEAALWAKLEMSNTHVPQRAVIGDGSGVDELVFFEDPETGAKKQIKKAQLGAIDPKALLLLAEAAGYGAEKYEQYNYLKGYPWSLSFNAMMRHALAFWNGEDLDPESGLPHMVHAAWHGLAMTSFLTRELGVDDRFKEGE